MSPYARHIALVTQLAAVGAVVMIGFWLSPGFAATVSRSLDIEVALSAVRSMIGRLGVVRKRMS